MSRHFKQYHCCSKGETRGKYRRETEGVVIRRETDDMCGRSIDKLQLERKVSVVGCLSTKKR